MSEEKEITVIIPSSRLNDQDFITEQLNRTKLRILKEVSVGSDRTIESLLKEYLPDVITNKVLLNEFNIILETDSSNESNDTKTIKSLKFKAKPKLKIKSKPESSEESKPESNVVSKPTVVPTLNDNISNSSDIKSLDNSTVSVKKTPKVKTKVSIKKTPIKSSINSAKPVKKIKVKTK
tara:strand:+ start:142 stop:678 length:537 start_codon:yes stop_codon:yes gene_type:complete